MPDINNKIAYIIAVVNEFSTRFSLNPQQAYRYFHLRTWLMTWHNTAIRMEVH